MEGSYNRAMTLQELDRYFRSLLKIEELEKSDSSMNGIQVGLREQTVDKVSFAVDACMQTFVFAEEWGADLLFVHHGLFWGKPLSVTDTHYRRLSFLLSRGLSIYACHLPLDMHEEFGNNAALAQKLGIEELKEFGVYHGIPIGWQGILPRQLTLDQILDKIGLTRESALCLLPFGPERISSVGIVAGGAAHEIEQALQEKLDLYITGEASHVMYHAALEGKMNVIAGGHYNTEIWGVKLLAEKCARETGVVTQFIDNPTGL
jgi:dinuclear metal center YbgI/SA1388 family protein